jgi:ABC-type dipeptide/oligopeptide/nickel transport systems, permease components
MSMLRGIALRIINLTVILLVVLIVIAAVLSGPASQVLKDTIQRETSEMVTTIMLHHPMTPAQAEQLKQTIIKQLENAYGLNKPVYIRVFYVLFNILSFNWGFSYYPDAYGVPSGSVVSIIMSALPGTIILDTLAYC